MDISILWYSALPALSTLFCLFFVVKYIIRGEKMSSIILYLSMALMSLFQTSGYVVSLFDTSIPMFFADAFLICLYFFFSNMALFALNLNPEHRMKYSYLIYCFPIALSLLHVSGYMVESYRFEQNTLMHNDGRFAWLFDIYALLCCVTTFFSIAHANIKKSESWIVISKSKLLTISFLPIAFSFAVLALLSRTDFAISLAIAAPLLFIYTALVYHYIGGHKVIDCSTSFRPILERIKLANEVLHAEKKKSSVKGFSSQIESLLLNELMEDYDGNFYLVAKEYGVHHITVRNKVKEGGYTKPY